ncbi:hypothetical protein E8E14_009179 [Neopestalotiopsis sp. 37M]|nr:hypothetical protein E8E14_009179 [Neopestalotiopsis sp. 37M]
MAPYIAESDAEMANTAESVEVTAVNGGLPSGTDTTDVCIVGAGPSGLMLATVLTRFGIHTEILDERPDQTAVGRADGIQPKTIETFRMLGVADELMRLGIKIFDICIWRDGKRIGREVHYPDSIVDLLEPYILIGHQGMIEKAFLDDLHQRGVEVKRSHRFSSCQVSESQSSYPVEVHSKFNVTQEEKILRANYVVGCDGAHSAVRNMIFDSPRTAGSSIWGVLDGELDTNFPDIWSKSVIFSEEHGSILIIPRERNMTRFYIEMKETASSKDLGQEYVMQRARDILSPYKVEWKNVEWFGKYQVAQKVASKFMDPTQRIFIGGDASHSHSPKAAQGMNTSVHDTWNLGWKLNLAVRGLAKPVLLQTYEEERKKIGQDLIDFDYEHANQIAGGDAAALAENFKTNIRFICGVGAEYGFNVLNNMAKETIRGTARPGCTLTPTKATRYYDANPVDVHLDIPILGQFRIYTFVKDVTASAEKTFLDAFSKALLDSASFISQISAAAARSYKDMSRKTSNEEVYTRPERYTAVSELITYALITSTDKSLFEISELPAIFSQSPWTVYLDDVPQLDTKGQTCTQKWLGELGSGEIGVMVVRPDGYVGTIHMFDAQAEGKQAAQVLDGYFNGFLQLPPV